jgi:hypothetical protein
MEAIRSSRKGTSGSCILNNKINQESREPREKGEKRGEGRKG